MFAPGAARYLGALAAVVLVLAALPVTHAVALSAAWAALLLSVLALWIFFSVFFRDPERVVARGIVSAADGRVREVAQHDGRWLVSVFMNVHNVHVNRLPLDATVSAVSDGGSGFHAAYRPDAERNVQRHYRLATSIGEVEVVQITGVVARRLVSFVRAGSTGTKGERFGMIVLGSRVDVLWPVGKAVPSVRVGDRVYAGASTIAELAP